MIIDFIKKLVGTIKKIVVSRIFLIAVMLILQLIVVTLSLTFLSEYSAIIQVLLDIISVLVVLYIITKNNNPAYKIIWIILISFEPLFGAVLYLLLGSNRTSTKFKQRMYKEIDESGKYLVQNEAALASLYQKNVDMGRQAEFLMNVGGYPVYQNTSATYFKMGEQFFLKFIEDLKRAEKFIFIEIFIVREGLLWDTIFSILKMKAQEGVEVKFLYDDVGSLFTVPNKFWKKVSVHGIECRKFNQMKPSLDLHMNNRDHRKIISIDGNIAYTGGCNLADEYINAFERFGTWKDTMIRLEGEAAFSLTLIFLQLWRSTPEQEVEIDYLAYKPEKKIYTDEDSYFIPFAENPIIENDTGVTTYLNMITRAERSVKIMSPYFILDNEMLVALCCVAQSGIAVEIIVPHIPDKWLVMETTKSYYDVLIEAGARIYEYSPGFIHAKSIIVDGTHAVIGTINFDYRSFYLHFECGVWLNDKTMIADMDEDFCQTVSISREVSLSDAKSVGAVRRIFRSVLRVLAPLM